MSNIDELKEALNQVSAKKHLVLDEAMNAKTVIDENETLLKSEFKFIMKKQRQHLKEFNTSIALLTRLFGNSRFDTTLAMVASPLKLLSINFFLGVIRGVGFFVGAGLVAGTFFYVFKDILVHLFL